ncbi:MAG: coenzyme F420-0:L-glutamate ligase [Aeromicrobium sp.]
MTLSFRPVEGLDEVRAGDDIAEMIVGRWSLRHGDVVVVTSKIVSKAAGLTTTRTKDDLLATETDRVVARRGETLIVRTHHGLTMAAAGIDNSNTAPGTLIPLPPDPDASASAIRARLHEAAGARVAVIISDTAGRAWRVGQTDIAIGCAGILPVDSFSGQTDPYGNPLAVTAPAIVDQIAGGAELASGKFGARPVVVVRGASPQWLLDEDGPGARSLIRDEDADMFGLGAREAAVAAILGDGPVRGLPVDPGADIDDIIALALRDLTFARSDLHVAGSTVVVAADHANRLVEAGVLSQRLTSLAVAHGILIDVRVESR